MRDDVFLPGRLAELCVPLKHVTKPVSAGITLGPHRVPKRHASGYLRVANVRKGWIDTSDIATLEEQKQDRPRYQLARGDVLVVEGHADPGQIGRAAIVTDEHAGLLYQNHLYRLRFTRAVPEFAVLWLNSPYVRSYWMTRCATSSGLYTINSTLLEEVPFPALGEAEQRRIVAAHKEAERRIAALGRLRNKLNSIEAALVSEVLAETLDRVPLSSWLDRIEAGKSPLAQDTPAGDGEWGVLKVSAVQADGFLGSENKVVRDAEFINPQFEVRSGDLLMTRANTEDLVGLACVVENPPPRLMLSDKTLRLVVDDSMADVGFVAAVLSNPVVRAQIKSAATGTSGSMKNISQGSIERLLVPDVPLEEQRRVQAALAVGRRRVNLVQRQIAKLRTTQLGLMEDLLSGRVSLPPAEFLVSATG